MPNRLLRDWTDSDKVNQLSVHAERFFTRLIMKVDDYGCFFADCRLLKANLFPLLLDSIREADILRWMADCQKAGLIVLYESNKKEYLQINDFNQRLRQKTLKYPLPTHDGHTTDIRPPEVEEKLEVEVEEKGSNAHSNFDKHFFSSKNKKEKKEHSPGAENWNTRPGINEMDLELPDIKIGSIVELFRITKNIDVNDSQVLGLWSIFKSQNFGGEKFYQSKNEVYKHFMNWCKTQTIKNGGNQSSSTTDYSKFGKSAGAIRAGHELAAELGIKL
jgi:hypothetical protein